MMCAGASDYKYLVKDFDKFKEDDVEKFISKNKDLLSDSFDKIQSEYSGLTFSDRELERHKMLFSMMYMEIKHNAITKIVNVFISTKEKSVLDLLNGFDIKIDKSKPIKDQLEKARRATVTLRNKLNIATANFKAKYKINDEQLKDEISDTGDVEKSLDRMALTLESNLETGYHIDIRKTSVLRWINLNEANERKLEQFNK